MSVEWRRTPARAVPGVAARAEFALRDRDRKPIRGATLQVEGHMTHPGMTAPVVVAAKERDAGVYQVELRFTMQGEWILLLTGELPDKRRISRQVDVITAGPAN